MDNYTEIINGKHIVHYSVDYLCPEDLAKTIPEIREYLQKLAEKHGDGIQLDVEEETGLGYDVVLTRDECPQETAEREAREKVTAKDIRRREYEKLKESQGRFETLQEEFGDEAEEEKTFGIDLTN